jgi:MscS family membrane protein
VEQLFEHYFFDLTIWGNSMWDYIYFTSTLLIAILFRRYFSKLTGRILFAFIRRKDNYTNLSTFHELVSKPLSWIIFMVFVAAAFSHIQIPDGFKFTFINKGNVLLVARGLYKTVIIALFTWFTIRLIDFLSIGIIEKKSETDPVLGRQIFPFLREMLKVFTVIFGFFFVLGLVFELNVANMVAGLGIGGLAVALAAKESLENLFASFTIFLDKPFVVGDLVTVNGITGEIEKVGFRSSRIRTLEKSIITLPNKQLIDNILDNLTLRTSRRIEYNIGLLYSTPLEKLKLVTNEIREMLLSRASIDKEALFVHFFGFADSSLTIRIICFTSHLPFGDYLKEKEEINHEILRIVKENDCEFAFPTRTLHVYNESITSD